MKRIHFLLLVAVTLVMGSIPIARADESAPLKLGLFANAKDVFPPLLADPHEVTTSLHLVSPVGKTLQGEVTLGQYFGLYRWALPWQQSYVQWSIGGAAFPRFDLATERKDFEIVDYIAIMPVDLRVGSWSMRLLPYHISSHLGDDYILKTGAVTQKYSFDSFKQLLAYDRWGWRVYGGYNYVIRSEYVSLGRFAAQTGLEWRGPWWINGHAQPYFATDFQSWQRVGWNPQLRSQIGMKVASTPTDRQAVSIFLEYGAGHRYEGQFFEQQETRYVLGLRFDI